MFVLRHYYVYITASRSGVLYIGMTNDLERRIRKHKGKVVPGFTARYRADRLVYCQAFATAGEAIAAEKKIKGWRREKKVALIESVNPTWLDLSLDWEDCETGQSPAPMPPP